MANEITLHEWVMNAIYSGLDDETKIRIYAYPDYGDYTITKGTINDIYKECRIDGDLAETTIHNWYAWKQDDIVINLNENPHEDIKEIE